MKQFVSAGFVVAMAFIGLASSAIATEPSVANSPLAFANADKNHDGSISRSEVPNELHDLRAHFDQYDENHDHRLSPQEYSGFLTAMVSGACQSNDQGVKNPNCHGMPGVMGSEGRNANTNSDVTRHKQF